MRWILERYRDSALPLRVFYGDRRTDRDWTEENHVVGRVRRSTGTLKIPLIVADGSAGGPGVLDACIARLMDVKSRRGLYLYRTYSLGEIEIRPRPAPKGCTHGMWMGDEKRTSFRFSAVAAIQLADLDGQQCARYRPSNNTSC